MPARGRLAFFLAVSLLAHGLLIFTLPAPGFSFRAPVFLSAMLRPSVVTPTPSPAPRSRAPAAASPASPTLPVVPEALGDELRSPLPEPSAEPASVAATPIEEGQNPWREGRREPGPEVGQALLREAERRRQEAQYRAAMIGSMWMGMYQRLATIAVDVDGICTLRRQAAFRPDCDSAAVRHLAEDLNLREWVGRLAEFDASLAELQLSAAGGRMRLQAVAPPAAAAE